MLVLVLVGLVLAEVGLRHTHPELAGLVYARDVTGGHPIILSEDGYRIPAGSNVAKGDPYVLALGDSTTFGTGVGAEDTWPLQLADWLPQGAAIRNAGGEGAFLSQVVQGVDEIWSRPDRPRVVLLLITPNLISFSDFHRNTVPGDLRARTRKMAQVAGEPLGLKRRIKNAVQSSALWKSINDGLNSFEFAIGLQDHRVDPDRPLSPLMAYNWVQPGLEKANFLRMWSVFEAGLADLKSHVEAQGACLILGFLPPRFMISVRWQDNLKWVPKDRLPYDAEAGLADIAARLDLRLVSTADALRKARASHRPGDLPLYIPGDYTHLDPVGHRVVAEAFAQVIGPALEQGSSCHGAARN